MFSIASKYCTPKACFPHTKHLDRASLVADLVTITACAVIFALAISGVLTLCPALAYPLLGGAILFTIILAAVRCRFPSKAESILSKKIEELARDEVAMHNERDDCWIIIDGDVYDVTPVLDQHPGGDEVLLDLAGKDATENFKKVDHTQNARRMLTKCRLHSLETIGQLVYKRYNS